MIVDRTWDAFNKSQRHRFDSTLDQIHGTALKILQEIGIALYPTPRIHEILADCGIRISDGRAFFTPSQIEAWLEKAPSQFTLEARNPEHSVRIGGDHSICCAGYGCAAMIDRDGTRREGALDDLIQFVKLVHQSPHLHLNGGILIQPLDVPIETGYLTMPYTTLLYSDKPPILPPGSEKELTGLMELLSIVYGGKETFTASYKTTTFISTISPLKIDPMALDSMIVSARYRQPILLSPSPAAGTTGPINPAGNLALATAETLAGVAIIQMLAPGLPVVAGMNCMGADLRTGSISIGSPAVSLQLRYAVALLKRYGLPSRGGGALTDAKVVSPQSGYESMLTLMTALQHNVHLVSHSAGILDSFAGMSVDKFMMDLELLEMAKFSLGDVEIRSDADFSFDAIQQAKDTGQFLTTMETLSRCRTHSWNPRIGVRGALAANDYNRALFKNIDDTLSAMLAQYQQPALAPQTITALEDYLHQNGLDRQTLARIKASEYPPD